MTEKKLDEILFKLKRLAVIEDAMIELSDNQKKIYALLSPESQETVKKELENIVSESIKGTVSLVTEKAVKIIVGSKYAWIPKKCIANLDKIMLEQDSNVEIELVQWFYSKIEWKAID